MGLTKRQKEALETLARRHDGWPERHDFATCHLGKNTVAILRKLVALGLVTATKGGCGMRQFFSITDAGRAALQEAV